MVLCFIHAHACCVALAKMCGKLALASDDEEGLEDIVVHSCGLLGSHESIRLAFTFELFVLIVELHTLQSEEHLGGPW